MRKFLTEIESAYKSSYLPDASITAEVLVYKSNQSNLIEDMVDDIERLEMDMWDEFEEKFKDWVFGPNKVMAWHRYNYTRNKIELIEQASCVPIYDIEELELYDEHYLHRDKIYEAFVSSHAHATGISLSLSLSNPFTFFQVPHYGVDPNYDPSIVGWFRALLGYSRSTSRKREEFLLRDPFY